MGGGRNGLASCLRHTLMPDLVAAMWGCGIRLIMRHFGRPGRAAIRGLLLGVGGCLGKNACGDHSGHSEGRGAAAGLIEVGWYLGSWPWRPAAAAPWPWATAAGHVPAEPCDVGYRLRYGRKVWRISPANRCGSSEARKWPPRSSTTQRSMAG